MIDSTLVSKACSALSHPLRVDVFVALLAAREAGMMTGALARALDIAPSTLSHHLRELEAGGVIERENRGRATILRARTGPLNDILKTLSALCCADDA